MTGTGAAHDPAHHPLDLGTALRGLRRNADLSQRELATRSGVPASTIARIESGNAYDPRLRTIERLVVAAGGVLPVGSSDGRALAPLPAPQDDHLGDAAGRRYPAHLDIRPVKEAGDWWGAWWADWYKLPRHRWPRRAPNHTYDLDRAHRDTRRRRSAGRRAVATLRIEHRQEPDAVHRWIALDNRGTAVGWAGGVTRSLHASTGHELDTAGGTEREFILCHIEVAPGWRRLGLGTRLVDALRDGLHRAGIAAARVLLDGPEVPPAFFFTCGFHRPRGPHPEWLTMRTQRPGQPAATQVRIR